MNTGNTVIIKRITMIRRANRLFEAPYGTNIPIICIIRSLSKDAHKLRAHRFELISVRLRRSRNPQKFQSAKREEYEMEEMRSA